MNQLWHDQGWVTTRIIHGYYTNMWQSYVEKRDEGEICKSAATPS